MSKLREIELLMTDGCWEQALEASMVFVQRQPAIPEGHAYLGICHEELGQYEPAAESLKKALILKPRDWRVGIRLAECLDRLGRYEEALEAATQAAKNRPSNEHIQGLLRGLRNQVPEKITDGWQVSQRHSWYTIDLKEGEET